MLNKSIKVLLQKGSQGFLFKKLRCWAFINSLGQYCNDSIYCSSLGAYLFLVLKRELIWNRVLIGNRVLISFLRNSRMGNGSSQYTCTLTELLLEWGCLLEWGSLLNRGSYSNYQKQIWGGCSIIRKGSLIGRSGAKLNYHHNVIRRSRHMK